jgi:AcrR family transcriptional regulator
MTDSVKQTEERIFDAATIEFIEEGMAGARMQNIADRAGINKALLHYYFRTKEHLFEAVFTFLSQKLFAKFSPIFEETLTLGEKIRFFYNEHISFLQENPKLAGFIICEINRKPERIKKILASVDFEKFLDEIFIHHSDEMKQYNINKENLPQVLTTIVSLSVFPFAAKGILDAIFSKIGVDYNKYIEERKVFAADFVLKALTK